MRCVKLLGKLNSNRPEYKLVEQTNLFILKAPDSLQIALAPRSKSQLNRPLINKVGAINVPNVSLFFFVCGIFVVDSLRQFCILMLFSRSDAVSL